MEETAKAIVALHRAAEGSHRPIRMAGAARDLGEVELGSSNEWPMTRYFPGLVESLKANLPKRYVVDGDHRHRQGRPAGLRGVASTVRC